MALFSTQIPLPSSKSLPPQVLDQISSDVWRFGWVMVLILKLWRIIQFWEIPNPIKNIYKNPIIWPERENFSIQIDSGIVFFEDLQIPLIENLISWFELFRNSIFNIPLVTSANPAFIIQLYLSNIIAIFKTLLSENL